MRVRLILGWLVLFSLVAAIGYAQAPAPAQRTLSLREALDIARRSNPDLQSTMNDRWGASRNLLSATTSLFTPSVSVDGNYYHRGSGTQYFQGIQFLSPGSSQRSSSLSLRYGLSGATLANRGLAAAELRATDEDIAGARTQLETTVRSQYLIVLQAMAQEDLARRSLERATENLSLAQARYSVGQGTLIDVRRAEVEKGQADVAVLRAGQNTENGTLLLFQRLGIQAPEPARVQLTDSFPVVQPTFQLEQLVQQALNENPGLRGLRARETSARWSTRSARSEYLPSLNFSASTGRTTSQVDTAGAVSQSTTSPWSFSVGISLPLFDGFSRYVRTAQARAREDDLSQAVRARQLQVRTEVTTAFHALDQAFRTIAIQRSNKAASAEALELATQRYRVGSGTYLELLDARVSADRADADYVGAVYDYHRAIATLENAVGRPLR